MDSRSNGTMNEKLIYLYISEENHPTESNIYKYSIVVELFVNGKQAAKKRNTRRELAQYLTKINNRRLVRAK